MRLVDLRPAFALCLIVTFAVPATGAVSFRTVEEEDALVDGSENPQAITIADVDGDGVGDLIAVEPELDTVTVFLNDGDGELDFGEGFDTDGEGPVAVATGRFNADNFIDLVTANSLEGTVSVLLNDPEGSGFFDEEDPRRFQVAANPIGIAVGDFNGDTRADLAVLSPDTIYLLQGNGDGTFSAFNPATISTRSNDSYAIAVGLLNADSNPDLAVTNRDGGQVVVFLGNGNGTFNFNGFVSGVGSAPTGIIIADADGNQTNDLLVVDSEALIFDEVRLLRNNGEAEFAAGESVTSGENPLAITGFDIEPDGKVDLGVTTTNPDQISVLCQPSMKCTQVFGSDLEAGIWRPAVGGTIPGCTSSGQVAIASGKLNNDDMDDLIALEGDLTTLCVIINTSTNSGVDTPTPVITMAATPTPTGPTATPTVTPTPTDTATPTQVPTIGLGVCSTNDLLAGTSLGRPVSVTNGDFNRDGTPDIAVADETGNRIAILLTTLTGGGENCQGLTLGLGPPVLVTGPSGVVAADFNRDGSDDLAVIGSQGLSVFYGNGAGGFSASAANPMPAGGEPSDIAVTDFNRDSTPDLIVSDAATSNVSIFIGTRDLAQPFGSGGRCGMPVGRRTNRVIATDLNADGRSDFAVTGPETLDIGVFLQLAGATLTCGNIEASFQGQTPLGDLPGEPTGLVAGVFAQTDNIPDLVVITANAGTGFALMFEGRAAGTGVTYQRGTDTAVPTPKVGGQVAAPSAIGTGDIERDGKIDLLITDLRNDTLAEFRGQGSGGLGVGLDTLALSDPVGGPVALTVKDIDRDGRDDVVVANAANGTLSYLLSGKRLFTPTPTATAPPTPTTPAPTAVGTATSSPTITQTPTRSRRPSATPTPVPTNTQRGVVSLSGGGCNIDDTSHDSGAGLLAAFALILFTFRRRAPAPSRG